MIEPSIDYRHSEIELAVEDLVFCQHQNDKVIIQFRNISHLCKQHAKKIHEYLKYQVRGDKDVVVDHNGIISVDAQGLAVLIYFHKKVTDQNRHLTLTNPSSSIRKLLWFTEIDRLIPIESENEINFAISPEVNSIIDIYDPVSLLTREKKYR